MRKTLHVLALVLGILPLSAQAQIGYVITQNGDSLAGPIIYQYAHNALHLMDGGQVTTISTRHVRRFAIYDGEASRFRRFEPIAALDSLAPDGSRHENPGLSVICEVLPLSGGGRLLVRHPYRYVEDKVPSLASAFEPAPKSAAERRLRRIAKRASRQYEAAEPVYYVQREGRIHCVSPVKNIWRLKWRIQDSRRFVEVLGETGRHVRAWMGLKGNPLMREKRMEDFVQSFCLVEHKDYARP